MLLGQVDMEKRFMDLDGLEQQERLNEDMESGLELEYAFDTEDGADGAGVQKTPVPEEPGNRGWWRMAGKWQKRTGEIRQPIPFPTVCSAGNSAWSRKRK